MRDCFIVPRNASPGQLNYNQDLGGGKSSSKMRLFAVSLSGLNTGM